MEVVAVTVKKILIIARNAGSGELTYYNRIDSEFSEMAMARDADAIAEGILQSGYTPVVYAPRATYDKNYYAHYARFVEKATVLYTAEELATELPEISAAVLSGVPAKAGTAKIMALYSEKVMDHFTHPRNVGVIENADGVGEVGNAKCGDIMKIYLKVDNNIISDVKFETFGCGSAIASSSMATEMIKGKSVDDALTLSNKAVAEALDGLPAHKMHCSVLAEEAIKKAVEDYRERTQGEKK